MAGGGDQEPTNADNRKISLIRVPINAVIPPNFVYLYFQAINHSTDGKLEFKEEWYDFGKSTCTVVKY